jgi:hypothetical protein
MEAFNKVNEAKELFNNLPAEVRKSMGHNPSNLVNFFTNDANKKLLEKYDLIEKKPDEVTTSPETASAPSETGNNTSE